jgi:hypothetical protein
LSFLRTDLEPLIELKGVCFFSTPPRSGLPDALRLSFPQPFSMADKVETACTTNPRFNAARGVDSNAFATISH